MIKLYPLLPLVTCFLHLLHTLTPVLTADSITKTSTHHLLAALVPDPALPFIVVGTRIGTACSLNGRIRQPLGTGGSEHNSTCSCIPSNREQQLLGLLTLKRLTVKFK